jgi:hypothetical protein
MPGRSVNGGPHHEAASTEPQQERNAMPLPQDIRPAFQDIQDTLVRSD